MGFSVSKAWSSTKKAVKKVAKGIKKVARKVAKTVGLGGVWDAGTDLLQGAGRLMGELGPVGAIALSFVLPGIGSAISSMWAGFGANAAAMAASANAMVSSLGAVGSAIFNGANYVGSTLGAMGQAISDSAGALMKGEFATAGNAFSQGMADSFSVGSQGLSTAADKALVDAGLSTTLAAPTFDPTSVVDFGVEGSVGTTRGIDAVDPLVREATGGLPIDITNPALDVQASNTASAVKANDIAVAAEWEAATTAPAAGDPFDLGKAATAAGALLNTGGAGVGAGLEPLVAGRQRHEVSGAGGLNAITGFQGGNIYQRLLAQAGGVV